VAASLLGPKGALTVIVVNESDREAEIAIEFQGLSAAVTLSRYAMTKAERDRAEVDLLPQRKIEVSVPLRDRIPGMSIIAYSTYGLGASDPGAR